MVDQNTDFFQITDNFKTHAGTASVCIIPSNLGFVPTVTIVIPTYKRTDLLKEALDSAINQTGYDSFDIIVSDDDPTRGCETEKLMSSYSNNRISYYKNEANLKMIGNTNRCFELAKAKWVVMIHDDDLLLPSFLSECMKVIEKHPDTGILKPAQYQLHDRNQLDPKNFPPSSEKITRIYDTDHLLSNRIGANTGILFNREKFFSLGGFNPRYLLSMDLCLVVLFSHFYEVYKMDKVLSVYRWISNSSLNVDTLTGFVMVDFHLYSFLFKYFKVPRGISANILNLKFNEIENTYKKVNPDFSFDVKTLGIQPISTNAGKVYFHLLRLITFFYRAVYFLKGNPLFKKRIQQAKFYVKAKV
jgi:glycosyltransferase